jgi:hypothetical protein
LPPCDFSANSQGPSVFGHQFTDDLNERDAECLGIAWSARWRLINQDREVIARVGE